MTVRMNSGHQEEYHHRGWTLLRGAMTYGLVAEVAAISNNLLDAGEGITISSDGTGEVKAGDFGGAYHHELLDGLTVRDCLPSLWGWYDAMRWAVSAIVARPIILSPYPRSAVNVKRYRRAGDCQGWHFDTNAVTALLYLTDDGHPTRIIDLFGDERETDQTAGDLLLMQGRRCRHEVPPLPEATCRMSVPLNYYHPDDVERPEGVDEIVYGAS